MLFVCVFIHVKYLTHQYQFEPQQFPLLTIQFETNLYSMHQILTTHSAFYNTRHYFGSIIYHFYIVH